MTPIGALASSIVQILTFAILIRVILSWFPIGPNNPFYTIVYQITEPILGPLRRIIPRAGVLDFTPLVAILLLTFLQALITRL